MSVHDDVVAQVGTCSNPACEACSPAEEDLSDEALEGRFDLGAELQRVDAADVEALKAMSAETESILRENAETRADLGLDDHQPPHIKHGIPDWGPPPDNGLFTTTSGDVADAETGEVLKDAPGWRDGQILNRDGLEWAGRRLREVEEALAENHRAAAAELKELEERLRKAQERHEKADAPLLASRAFFDAAIRAYADGHRAELLKGRRGKTVRLPSGLVLAWKSGGGEYRWRKDMKPAEREAALLAWAKETAERVAVDLPPMVESVERPILANVKVTLAALDNPEEPHFTPPGLEYVPEHEELNIKVEP